MRYDDILHETLITSINGILANPANQSVKVADVVEQAWKIAVATANYAKAASTLIPSAFTYTAAATPADAAVSTTVSGNDKLNNPTTSTVTTDRPTSVISPDGTYLAKR